jgi:hypothetical protein
MAVIPDASWFRKKEIYLSTRLLEEIDPEKQVFFIQQTKREIENQLPEILALEKDPQLKPAERLLGFTVKATDGEIGTVEDLIVNDADLAVRYLTVNLKASGKKFILSPWWSEKINWETRNIYLAFTLKEVYDSPQYDFLAPVSREYEDELHDYYGRRSYWA